MVAPAGSGERGPSTAHRPASLRQHAARAGQVVVATIAWLLFLIAFGAIAVIAIALQMGAAKAVFALTMVASLLGMLGHVLLIGSEQFLYRLSRTRWVELPREIIHRYGPKARRLRALALLEVFAMFAAGVLLIASTGDLTTSRLVGVSLFLVCAMYTLYLAIQEVRMLWLGFQREIVMNERGLRIMISLGDSGRMIPWTEVETVTFRTIQQQYGRMCFLILQIRSPERYGLKPAGALFRKTLRAAGNIVVPVSGYLESAENIVADVNAFHGRYSASQQPAAVQRPLVPA